MIILKRREYTAVHKGNHLCVCVWYMSVGCVGVLNYALIHTPQRAPNLKENVIAKKPIPLQPQIGSTNITLLETDFFK